MKLILFLLAFIFTTTSYSQVPKEHLRNVNHNHQLLMNLKGDSLGKYQYRLRLMQRSTEIIYFNLDMISSSSDSIASLKIEKEMNEYVNYLSRGVRWHDDIVWEEVKKRFRYFDDKIYKLKHFSK